MKYSDLKDKSFEDLGALLKEKKTELFGLRMKKQLSQLQNVSEIRMVRKDIARINTAIKAVKKASSN
jgi:large subunit ribosomal protein L29